jgi:hypothetical protein
MQAYVTHLGKTSLPAELSWCHKPLQATIHLFEKVLSSARA